MIKIMSEYLGVAILCMLVFFIADGWRQAWETNRFIEQLLDAVDKPDVPAPVCEREDA